MKVSIVAGSRAGFKIAGVLILIDIRKPINFL